MAPWLQSSLAVGPAWGGLAVPTGTQIFFFSSAGTGSGLLVCPVCRPEGGAGLGVIIGSGGPLDAIVTDVLQIPVVDRSAGGLPGRWTV